MGLGNKVHRRVFDEIKDVSGVVRFYLKKYVDLPQVTRDV
jgi:hypothetical protein